MAEDFLSKSEAEKVIQDSARDYLTLKLTLPLGNPDLKKVHTNQFLFTELPAEFTMKNWELISEVFSSSNTRYSQYVLNRWYIEGVNITVEANGKAEMSLDLNAFPSSTSKYAEDRVKFEEAYTSALNNQNSESNDNNTSNAYTNNGVLNDSWIKQYNISSTITSKVESICNTSNSTLENVKALFNWFDKHIRYCGYSHHKKTPEKVISSGCGNCVDCAITFRQMCQSLGVKCNFIQNTCTSPHHWYNKVYIDNNTYIVDVGRGSSSWGSNWGGHASCGREKSSAWGY